MRAALETALVAVLLVLSVYALVQAVLTGRRYERDSAAREERSRRWWATFGDACATDAALMRGIADGCPRCTARLDTELAARRDARLARDAQPKGRA